MVLFGGVFFLRGHGPGISTIEILIKGGRFPMATFNIFSFCPFKQVWTISEKTFLSGIVIAV